MYWIQDYHIKYDELNKRLSHKIWWIEYKIYITCWKVYVEEESDIHNATYQRNDEYIRI